MTSVNLYNPAADDKDPELLSLGNFRVLNNDGDPSTPITVDLEVEITDFEGEMDSVFSYLRGPNYPGALVSPQWTIDKSVTPNIANFSWTLDARSASGIYELRVSGSTM